MHKNPKHTILHLKQVKIIIIILYNYKGILNKRENKEFWGVC